MARALAVLAVVAGCGRIDFAAQPAVATDAASFTPPSLELEPTGTAQILYGVWGSSPSDVYVAGEGAILHSTGDGTWTTQFTGPDRSDPHRHDSDQRHLDEHGR